MNSYGIIESFINFFFPFTVDGKIDLCENSSAFDFKVLQSVAIHAYRLTGSTVGQFILVFVPTDKTPKGFTSAQLSTIETRAQMRLSLSNLGYDIDKVEYVDGGTKNLSTPPELYKQDKAILRFRYNTKEMYILIPFSFLKDICSLAGHGWMSEISIERLRANFKESILSFERSILYGKCHLFQNLLRLLKSIDEKYMSSILSDMQSKNLLTYNHIASFHVFYQEEINLTNYLPAEVKKTVLRLASAIAPLLSDNEPRERWKRQMDYYFQNVFSILLMTNATNKNYVVDISKGEPISRLVNNQRLILLGELSSADKMIKEIIRDGRVNDLIGGEGKELFIESIAHGEKLPLDDLYKLFRTSFREEFNFKIREKEKKLQELIMAKRNLEYMSVKLRFLRFLADNIMKKFKSTEKSHITLPYLHNLLKTLDANKMTLLYNTLGFDLLVSIFDVLKYLPGSPIEPKEADSFLVERCSLLPSVEREIVEDIYFEKLNQDRLMSTEVIEKNFTEIIRKISAMEQMGYLEAING